ncbi:hypothetical protein ACVI55_000042 [Sinorhizobium medicae]
MIAPRMIAPPITTSSRIGSPKNRRPMTRASGKPYEIDGNQQGCIRQLHCPCEGKLREKTADTLQRHQEKAEQRRRLPKGQSEEEGDGNRHQEIQPGYADRVLAPGRNLHQERDDGKTDRGSECPGSACVEGFRTRPDDDQDAREAAGEAEGPAGGKPLAQKKHRAEGDEKRHGEGDRSRGGQRDLRDRDEGREQGQKLDDGPDRMDVERHRPLYDETPRANEQIERAQTGEIAEEDDPDRVNLSSHEAHDHAIHRRNQRIRPHQQGSCDDRRHGDLLHAASAAVCHFGFGVALMSWRV